MAFISATSAFFWQCHQGPGSWLVPDICYGTPQDAFWPAKAKTCSMFSSTGTFRTPSKNKQCLTPLLFTHQEAGDQLLGIFQVDHDHQRLSSFFIVFK